MPVEGKGGLASARAEVGKSQDGLIPDLNQRLDFEPKALVAFLHPSNERWHRSQMGHQAPGDWSWSALPGTG